MTIQRCKHWYFPMLLIMVLAFSFMLTSPAYADDGQPADQPSVEVTTSADELMVPSAQEESSPPEDTATPPGGEDPAPPDEPVLPTENEELSTPPANDPPVDEQPTEVEPAGDHAAGDLVTPPPEETIQEVAAALAENQVVLSDPSGSPLPLASRDTTTGVTAGDPYFTVGTTTYRFMKPGGCVAYGGLSATCQESTTPIQAALDYMETNNLTPTNRKLYILPDTYTGDVWVDGSLNGVKGLLEIAGDNSTIPGEIQINGGLYIYNMASGFTIRNLSVTNNSPDGGSIWTWSNKGTLTLVDVKANNPGTDGTGIIINHTGAVVLDRVTSSDNGYIGARIHNIAGTIKISNSEFDRNLQNVNDGMDGYDDEYDEFGNFLGTSPYYASLELYANGAISINGISASDNIGDGLSLSNYTSTASIKNSVFNNNNAGNVVPGWGDGIWAISNSLIMENVQARNNNIRGIFARANTSFTGINFTTDGNGDSGIEVQTCEDWNDGDTFCDNSGAGTVTIKNSASSGNGNHGYEVNSKGAITITDSWSGFNSGDGYWLSNANSPSPAAISITNSDTTTNASGFALYSRGAITMTNFHTDWNADYGVYIEGSGTGAVTLTNSGVNFNNVNDNSGDGVNIHSLGAVNVINTDIWNNAGYGLSIDNASAASAAPVTIKVLPTTGYINENSWNGLGGLLIQSRGIVTISKVRASNNNGAGATIFNVPMGTLPGVAVTISDSEFNDYDDSDSFTQTNGLVINSKGAITLLNVEATGNSVRGAYLNNAQVGTTAGVTINAGSNLGNYFLNNGSDGLYIFTNGAVTLTNVNATDNGEYGLYIDNSSGTGGVTIKAAGTWGAGFDYNNTQTWGNSYSRNGLTGMYILTRGAVNVTFNHASENDGHGIYISAQNGSGAVTLAGNTNHWGDVYENSDNGITIFAKGNISVSKVTASGNTSRGAYLSNTTGTGSVTLTDAWFENNLRGIELYTNGNVTWKNGSASNNFETGAVIINSTGVNRPVSITNVFFNANGLTGLDVFSSGAIGVINSEANNNSPVDYTMGYGSWHQDNLTDDQRWFFNANAGDDVTILVESTNINPYIYVLDGDYNWVAEAYGTDGALSLDLDDLAEGEYMIFISNDSGWNGTGYRIGVGLQSSNPDDWSLVTYNANGMVLQNYSGTNAPVTVTNTSGVWNGNNGSTNIFIQSRGAVTVSNMDINDSSENGLYIKNDTAATPANVTLTNVNYFNNDGIGTYIVTKGVVTVKNGIADGNNLGYYIDNTAGTGGITMTTVSASGNMDDGIFLRTNGAVSMTDVWAGYNGGIGIDLVTPGAVTFKNVDANGNSIGGADVTSGTFTILKPVLGYNSYNDNGDTGLTVLANGKVTMSSVSASWNGLRDEFGDPVTMAYGIFINNENPTGLFPVVLTDIIANANTIDGLYLTTTSATTVTNLETSNNTGYGSRINQSAGPALPPVTTLTGITARYNGQDGFYVSVLGNIVAGKIMVMGNGATGANFVNDNGLGTVTILNTKGANNANFNTGAGINITSNNTVTVSGVTLLGNGAAGLVAFNNTSPIGASVTFSGITSRGNSGTGIFGSSQGIVTINSSWSVDNRADGIGISTTKNAFINNTTAINNDRAGIWVNFSDPNLTLKLTNSTWFGNLRNPEIGDKNLMCNGKVTIL